MDTKWRKSKGFLAALSLLAGFWLALNLLFEGISLFQEDGGLSALRNAWEKDYQNTTDFQFFMESCLEDFLSMAVGEPLDFAWLGEEEARRMSYSSNYGQELFGYAMDDTQLHLGSILEDEGKSVTVTVGTDGTAAEQADEEVQSKGGVAEKAQSGGQTQTTDETQIAEETQSGRDDAQGIIWVIRQGTTPEEMAQTAADLLQNSPNLLYSIRMDGKELYTNAADTELDGRNGTMPAGYNFHLYFDGERVSVRKDGTELNIYGDGLYGDGDWFVPGYGNFPVHEKYRKAEISIAAVANPGMEVFPQYGGGEGSSDFSNTDRLYEIAQQYQNLREKSIQWGMMALGGLCLFAVCFYFRKEYALLCRRAAALTGVLWYEGKVLWLAGVLWGFWVWYYDRIGHEKETNAFPLLLMLLLFLGLWLNDCRYNSQPWKHSLTAILRRNLSLRDMRLPFQKRVLSRLRPLWLLFCLEIALVGVLLFNWLGTGLYTDYQAVLMCWAAVLLLVLSLWFLLRFTGMLRRACEDMGRLIDRTAAVRNGDMGEALLLPEDSDLYEAAVNLNEIQEGMQEAIEEQVKSERMKVELIANVSHDIKTPLTSIISYVDFLKEEENLPEHVKDYITILDGKAQRLKTMVQDVFEVSKAASGQLPVHLERIDCARLLRQTLADMEEEIEAADVTVRARIPEEEAVILADGQRLYRVFQNLIQNALKYSLTGSRVHIVLIKQDGSITASVSNTSAQELSEEIDYTARFQRGDDSRTDGGSGLGLSIARSFTEACGGKFFIEIKADLFTASVIFEADC